MSINKKIIVTAVAGLALGMSSCKKYLDVNNNPNVAQNGTVNTLLPAAQLYIGSAVGTDLQINGAIWSQFWTQSPDGKEYIPFDQCDPKAEAYNVGWKNLYAGASNFYQLYKVADAQYKDQYKGIALLMQAYTFQTLTDGWGDVPFTEALRGQNADGQFVNPKYDSQRVVYKGILSYIDSATSIMSKGNNSAPGTDDLIYGGNMNKWMRFANTLKLRTILRMSSVDPVYAQEMMDSLYKYNPQFLAEGDDAVIRFGNGSNNKNPLYAELSAVEQGGVQQIAGSKTVIDSMNSNNDYRGLAFYEPVNMMGLVGVTQSEYDITIPSGSFSIPSVYTGANATSMSSANAAVVLLSSWESYFLQAEAIARGMVTGDDAQMFYSGIRASYVYNSSAIQAEAGIAAITAYNRYVNGDVALSIAPARWAAYPVGGTADDKVRFIITQKWFAMAGNQGFEAWTELRRTGYPDFIVTPRNSRIGGKVPSRFLYPASEAATNSNYPGLIPVTIGIWWDAL
jgi:hypothetical protein